MKKDEIIELLKEQLRVANDTVSSLTTQVNELIERIKSLEELLVQKGIAIDKANRQNKALGKLVSGKKSERQEKNQQASMTQEEFDKKKTEQAEKRKARKNNGAKRDMHYEMKEVHVTIDPVMDAGLLKTLRLFGTRTCIRYSMEPIKFIKTVYHINTYTDGSIMYPGKTPPALLLNSSYSPSFAAGLLQMRYIYSMPVERIIKYFADNGFTLRKATANKLIARSADVLENFYKAICQVVLQQDYVSADETYHKVLLTKIKPTDKGSKKGYLWAVSAPKLGLVFCYKVLIAKAKAKGIKVYGGTITPTKGNGWYSFWHEAMRQTVNEWIRKSGAFDEVIDFDELTRDPKDPQRLKAEYSDDWLHLNPKGYEAMGKFAAEKLK